MQSTIDEQITAVKYCRDMVRNSSKRRQFDEDYKRMVDVMNDAAASLSALKLLQHEKDNVGK